MVNLLKPVAFICGGDGTCGSNGRRRAATSIAPPKRDEGVEATVRVATRKTADGTLFDIECLTLNTGAAGEIYNGFLSDEFRIAGHSSGYLI